MPAEATLSVPGRQLYRAIAPWEHEDVLERHSARMQRADKLMRQCSAIVEHPFGTIKCRAGYRHFLVRGFDKVRGECSLMALCYKFTRLLNILGLEHFMARIAKALWRPSCTSSPLKP
jgi:DDE family transposase